MRRLVSTLLVSGLCLSLASCASVPVPSQDQLTSGIDKSQIAQNQAVQRSEFILSASNFIQMLKPIKKRRRRPKASVAS